MLNYSGQESVYVSIYISMCVYIWQVKDTNLFILVCALAVYPHRSGWQTQISCRFQPPSTTVLIAVRFCSVSCNTWPTYESHEYIIPLFIYQDPKQKVSSSASHDAGAEGQQQHEVYHPEPLHAGFFGSGTKATWQEPLGKWLCPGHGCDGFGFSQLVSFCLGVLCTREIQQAKSYRLIFFVCFVFLHTTVETVTELYLSESQ